VYLLGLGEALVDEAQRLDVLDRRHSRGYAKLSLTSFWLIVRT
jgi:hypothetical protein